MIYWGTNDKIFGRPRFHQRIESVWCATIAGRQHAQAEVRSMFVGQYSTTRSSGASLRTAMYDEFYEFMLVVLILPAHALIRQEVVETCFMTVFNHVIRPGEGAVSSLMSLLPVFSKNDKQPACFA